MTPVEAQNVRVQRDRLRWWLSRSVVEPATEKIAFQAIELLRAAGLHGHKYAIGAVVAATALHYGKPVIILTSGEDDTAQPCGKAVRIVKS